MAAMNTTCRAWPALAVLGLLLVGGQPSEQEKARAEYLARQERLRCAAHPDQGCLTQPESENERAQREYRERQLRLRCDAHPTDVECR
jgi:hypothetical protein